MADSLHQKPTYAVVVGASAGGFTALTELVSQLKPSFDAAYFIVLHLSAKSISGLLAHRLQEHTDLKCLLAMDGLPIRQGHIYVAVPNHHLLIAGDEVKLGHGPSENRWRPSIDLLFRSAATYFNTRTIGIVLTGLLNDGTTGMSAIKRSGGTTIVQDPEEAEFPDMPYSVLKSVEVDYCVSLIEMGGVLEELTQAPPQESQDAPADVVRETRISEHILTDIAHMAAVSEKSVYTCPDCGGILFLHGNDTIPKFKCHIGHSYTTRDLMLKQSEETETSLWYAVRSLEQRRNLLDSLAERYAKTGNNLMATDYRKRSAEVARHVENLKKIIEENLDLPDDGE